MQIKINLKLFVTYYRFTSYLTETTLRDMKNLACLLVLAVVYLQSSAQNSGYLNYRPFLGISANYVLIAGSFDGKSYFAADEETILVPKLEPGFGFGINGGYRFRNFSIDFLYKHSSHNCSFIDSTAGKAGFNVIKYLGIKSYLGQSEVFQPFLDFDLSGAWMRVSNASYLESSPREIKKATYGALILGFGGGIALTFAHKLSFEMEILPAWYIGTNAKGIRKVNYEVQKFNSFKLDISTSLIYYFKSK